LCESSKHIFWTAQFCNLDCTIILLFGLHKIGWTAPLEYALWHSIRLTGRTISMTTHCMGHTST